MRNKVLFSLILVCWYTLCLSIICIQTTGSISEEPVSYTLDAESLFNEFTEDSQQAELKYLDQTIIVSGGSNLYKRKERHN